MMYVCKICGVSLKNRAEVREHMREAHPAELASYSIDRMPFVQWLKDIYPEEINRLLDRYWDEYWSDVYTNYIDEFIDQNTEEIDNDV